MLNKIAPNNNTKSFHTRNKHNGEYNFKALCLCCKELGPYVIINRYGSESIDFFNADAVVALNKGLLKFYYKIDNWNLPSGYLCPPVPSRSDYIHHVADLLTEPVKTKIRCLDIGVGANCIYPIVGVAEYGWTFVGSDIDAFALSFAQKIIDSNSILNGKIELRLQKDSSLIFKNIIQENDFFDISVCNPPFHASAKEAKKSSLRKLSNLKNDKVLNPCLNFGGKNNELWCNGGEEKFVSNLILESKTYAKSCKWFTTLVSKQSNLRKVYQLLNSVGAISYKTIEMETGNKKSRIVAWTFLK